MNSEDVKELTNIYQSMVNLQKEQTNDLDIYIPRMPQSQYNPIKDIEYTLIHFLETRLKKLEQDVRFENEIKQTLLDRLTEMDSASLIKLLDIVQRNNNQGTTAVLEPYLVSNNKGDSQNIIERTTKQEISIHLPEKQLFENADKNVLQGLNDLKNLLSAISQKIKSSKAE